MWREKSAIPSTEAKKRAGETEEEESATARKNSESEKRHNVAGGGKIVSAYSPGRQRTGEVGSRFVFLVLEYLSFS